MAKKKDKAEASTETTTAPGHVVKKEEVFDLKIENATDFVEETKEEEVVVGRNFTGGEIKETHTLKSKQVFEPMQGTFKTVWTKE